MKEKYIIDLLKEDKDIKQYIKKGNLNFKYVNLLEYCRNKYELSVIDLAEIFNVHRQTIYNNIGKEKTTNDLSENIITTLKEIYEVNSLEEILEIEKNLLIFVNLEFDQFNGMKQFE